MKSVNNVQISANRNTRQVGMFKTCKKGETYLLTLGDDIENVEKIPAMRSKAAAFAKTKGWRSLTQLATEPIKNDKGEILKDEKGNDAEKTIGLYVEFAELPQKPAKEGETTQQQTEAPAAAVA